MISDQAQALFDHAILESNDFSEYCLSLYNLQDSSKGFLCGDDFKMALEKEINHCAQVYRTQSKIVETSVNNIQIVKEVIWNE